MQKKWVLKEQGDNEVVKHLSEVLNISGKLANLLAQRGITNYEEAKAFFRPELNQLHSPFLMKDMDVAITRIIKAISNNEKIMVYGDYDVDGTTAVALVYSFFNKFYNNIDFYIPDRYNEGYGVSYIGIDYCKKNNFSLVISLDCGIKATKQIVYAKEKGIDFIICDHHRPDNQLPPAVAILDPKRSDCNYPFDELSGCGVGFKLIQAYAENHNIDFSEIEKYLDLVAISIASDIVNITGENRILAYFGLKKINTNPRSGIEAILEYCNIKRKINFIPKNYDYECIFPKELNISDLVFLVGPRINAAGRIENGRSAVELLIADNLKDASVIAHNINSNNNERRQLDTFTTQQAIQMVKENSRFHKNKSTVLFNPEWHKGVVGIVASRLTENFYRPTIVMTQSNGLITGSARSVKDFDIYDAIDACSDLLEHFGGHKYAAGLSLKPENLDAFSNKFEKVVSDTITVDMLTPEIEIDEFIGLEEINSKFVKILKQFAPFGPGNMAPIFQTKNVVDKGYARIVGNNHIKLNITYPNSSKIEFNAIAFQQADNLDLITKNIPFDICYHIDENEWNGNTSLQLNIKDLKWD